MPEDDGLSSGDTIPEVKLLVGDVTSGGTLLIGDVTPTPSCSPSARKKKQNQLIYFKFQSTRSGHYSVCSL